MRNEIGSEFWSVPLVKKNNHIFDDAMWFVSGRAAFRAIIQQIKIENCEVQSLKIALPSYLCESMITPIQKEDVEYIFYPVTFKDGSFYCDYFDIGDCNIVLLIDYFGYETLPNDFSKSGKIIIRDLTHSIFTKKYDDADYYFGSLRKWAGFLCGGFAWRKEGKLCTPRYSIDKYISLRKDAMSLKKDYIFGKTDYKDYLNLFHEAEDLLANCDIANSTFDDVNNAKLLDVELIKTARRNNASVLIEGLNDICAIKQMKQNDCPLFVPIVIQKRDELREYLITNNIYCPIHWPKPFDEQSKSDELYETELSLVCDQRYSIDDMKRIVSTIRKFMEE